jgi:N-acetylmuramoyl-L-alanine amidase
MIPLLLMLLQVADSVTAITVREGDHVTSVPIVFTRYGRMLRGDQVATPLGARLTRPDRDHFVLDVDGARIELTVGLPSVRIGSEIVPVSAAPIERSGLVYVPIGIVTDVIPRFVPGYAFSLARSEITRFRPLVAAFPNPSPPRASPTSVAPPSTARPSPRPRGSKWIVVVDAGHGGTDRGMKGPIGASRKIEEADITLAVARRLRDSLTARGVKVVMTRSTDTLIALSDRGRIANRAEADLFVSIHVNAANPRWRNPSGARGFETYFLSEAKTDDERRVAEMENDAAKYDVTADADPGDAFSYLLSDMRQNANLRESSDLAEVIQRGLAGVHPGPERGVKQAGFRVLVTAHMPAVLVELGFGTNAPESQYLASVSGQQRLAGAIAASTLRYLAQYELRKNSTGVGTR